MKWMLFLLSGFALTGCFNDNRDLDALASHQIIAAPANRWVHWRDETPVDVSEEKVISHKPCQRKPVD